jgi:hypothetical protein
MEIAWAASEGQKRPSIIIKWANEVKKEIISGKRPVCSRNMRGKLP